ncbi:methyltransferase domain-containing protein [Polyangium aurulentum]|uniref:methyltransferase domain-containing protein n=1 Tax=Polyangium aurulentum TaxID=2567896 RepID=UPI0010AEC7FD|nr:methyltransferase domain-containing protein [Polyangium aurulentum]UQA59245.1 methyltransferase domain-containing protein [Polyangium aurulentum]
MDGARLEDLERIVCPACRSRLALRGAGEGGRVARGTLACTGCGEAWPIEEGLPRLYREADVRGNDRLLRYFYDGLPSLHDASVRLLLPLFRAGTEKALRDTYMRRLDLGSLRPRDDGRPVRILEVGIGTGANLPLLQRELPRGLDVEIWGLDLSRGMLGQCQKRLRKRPDPRVRLLLGDAHALPFADGTFDRVFHVGALNSYRDPRRALAEMARVAVPESPIVVVDEQLDRSQPQNLYHRATFRLVTFYDPDPHCPVELLPAGAEEVREEQAGRFFYCLSFRMPEPARPQAT